MGRRVSWLYYVSRLVLRMALRLSTRWQVMGRENVPRYGAVLVVANHLSLIDPPLLGVSLERKIRFMAKEELFRSRLSRFLMRSLGAFPVHRGRVDRAALREAERVLARGQVLAMFPEGMRSRGQLTDGFFGSALIAMRSGVPIVPVGITGTEKVRKASSLLHRPRLTVKIGQPFRLPPVSGKLPGEELAGLTDDIMRHIAELLPPEYRGKYA